MMLDLLEDYLLAKGYFYERIDGKIRGSERQVCQCDCHPEVLQQSKTKSRILYIYMHMLGIGPPSDLSCLECV